MRRPTRTRRLSIAAIVSLLAFFVVAGAGVRSMWIQDCWYSGSFRSITLAGGRIWYDRLKGDAFIHVIPPRGHRSLLQKQQLDSDIFRLNVYNSAAQSFGLPFRELTLVVPLWPFLLLLLIAPVRWLIARPANEPAFSVITDAKQEHA